MIASCLSIMEATPEFSFISPDSVGDTTFCAPINAVMTLPIVPFPDRFGPTMRNIFCIDVSGVR